MVFVNTLTAGGNYPVQYWGNLQLPTPMQLSGKGKNYSQFFVSFREATSNIKNLEEKDDGRT